MNKHLEFINGRPAGISDTAWDKAHEIIAQIIVRLSSEETNKKKEAKT